MDKSTLPNTNFELKALNQIVVKIVKEHFIMICVILAALCGPSYWNAIILETSESPVVRVASSLLTAILYNSLMIVILHMAYKSIKGEAFDAVLPTIKRALVPYFITVWIVKIIMGFLIAIVATIVSGLTLVFDNYRLTVVLTTLSIIPIALYFLVRYAFALQLVVFDQKYYAEALNQSEKMSQGHRQTIRAIIILPIVITAIMTGLLEISQVTVVTQQILSSTLKILASVYGLMITTALYFGLKSSA